MTDFGMLLQMVDELDEARHSPNHIPKKEWLD
jgi:hypothetical protein